MQKYNIVRELEEIIREMRIECKVMEKYKIVKKIEDIIKNMECEIGGSNFNLKMSCLSYKMVLENYVQKLKNIIKDLTI